MKKTAKRSRVELDLKPTVEWQVVAQISAYTHRDGFTFAASIQQFGGLWGAIGVISPSYPVGAPSDPRRIMDAVFAQHGHQFIASSPDLAEVQAKAAEFCLHAPPPTELCPCPDLGSPKRSRRRSTAGKASA